MKASSLPASDPFTEHHHLVISMIGGHGGQIKRAKKRLGDKNSTSPETFCSEVNCMRRQPDLMENHGILALMRVVWGYCIMGNLFL